MLELVVHLVHLVVWIFVGRDRRKKLGWVADYCPRCRDVGAVRLRRVYRTSLARFVMRRQRLLGFEIFCPRCKLVMAVEGSHYGPPSKRKMADLDALIEATHPRILQTRGVEIDRASRAWAGELSSAERRALVRESLVAVEPDLQKWKQSDSTDWVTAVVVILGLLVGLTGLVAIVGGPVSSTTFKVVASVILIGLVVGAMAWAKSTDVRRLARRKCYPYLVPLLVPLGTTEAELAEVLEELRGGGKLVGRVVRADRLWRAMRKAAARRGRSRRAGR